MKRVHRGKVWLILHSGGFLVKYSKDFATFLGEPKLLIILLKRNLTFGNLPMNYRNKLYMSPFPRQNNLLAGRLSFKSIFLYNF